MTEMMNDFLNSLVSVFDAVSHFEVALLLFVVSSVSSRKKNVLSVFLQFHLILTVAVLQ